MARGISWGLGVCLAVATAVSACVGGDVGRSAQFATTATCPPEATTPDARGTPRNAAGHVRYCWPGEAHCYCDSDNDCYDQPGYTPCTATSTDGGASDGDAGACPPEATTPDARGTPRNAAGHVRYCFPGEAYCYCDSDNDCYDQPGYVACTPTSGGGGETGGGTPGASCALPVERELRLPSDTATGTTTRRGTAAPSCASGAAGLEAMYKLHVGARTSVEFRARETFPRTSGVSLSIRRVCGDASSEVACNRNFYYGRPSGLLRLTLEPGDYYVVVQGLEPTATSLSYVLDVAAFDAAPHATCEGAKPVSDGAVIWGEDTNRGGMPSELCGTDDDSSAVGFAHYYRATIPADHTLVIRPTRILGADGTPYSVRLGIRDACGDGARCLMAAADWGSAGDERAVYYTNPESSAREVVFWVSSIHPDFNGRYDLEVAIRPAAPNASCATARVVTATTTFKAENTGYGREASACTGRDDRALFYTATLAPGGTITADVRRLTGAFDYDVRLSVGGCGDGAVCVPPVPGSPATYTNSTSSPQTVVLAVSTHRGLAVTYDVTITLD